MANTKNYSTREKVLDKYLSGKREYTGKELIDFCNRELERRGMQLIQSRNTLKEDLDEISNKYNVIIDKIHRGRQWFYHYHDWSFSIYNNELSDEDLATIEQAISVVSKFEGMPQLDIMSELRAEFMSSEQKEPIVSYEDTSLNKGMEFFEPLFDAIVNRQPVNISYQKFSSEQAKKRIIYPYHLKRYNNRWFVFCSNQIDNKHRLVNYPLDRIKGLEIANVPYIPCSVDFKTYFDDLIGVSRNQDDEPQDVVFTADPEQFQYIITKPLHKSQQTDEKTHTIKLHVIINYELKQMLLQFCDRIKILQPDSLREEFKQKFSKSLQNY